MERLCDEVLQLIFYELIDPSPLTVVSKRLHRFSQDPYVRAHYFLTRYGPTEAMFYALGRGKVLTERVIDILLASGAHLSRYLIQTSMHHYFYTQSHFIKTPWVRNVPLRVFTYFLKISEEIYGDIPRGKGEDDGSIFTTFLKESRLPLAMKNVTWETIRDILAKYKFIPFCTKDPIMVQFPLALAIEPQLLPYAVENGFHMDSKYRDFVFRKMFERPTASSDAISEDIAHNIRELCRLDNTMFVSRTVAAEVCMEAKLNDTGYNALKQLDKSGHLRFELAGLVEDLIKTFIRTRSISTTQAIDILRYLYTDFPSSDPTARLVILITIFITSENLHSSPSAIHVKLEALGLTPVTRKDVYNILVNPFVDRYQLIIDYAKWGVGVKENGRRGMEESDVRGLVEEVASKCLELACKGKFFKKLYDGHPFLHDFVTQLVLEKYQIGLENLPPRSSRDARRRFEGRLCRDFTKFGTTERLDKEGEDEFQRIDDEDEDSLNGSMKGDMEGEAEVIEQDISTHTNLGIITQETLTTMIRNDEAFPGRSRRRTHSYGMWGDSSSKLPFPQDPLHIGRWAKNEFGSKSSVTAVFMTHAVINDNPNILHHYLLYADGNPSSSTSNHVPVTFKHFQILARLGKAPNFYLYHDIEMGAEFYFDENDYVKKDAEKHCGGQSVKIETSPMGIPPSGSRGRADPSACGYRGKKRPRRTATAVRSYAVPDSDDETIANFDDITKKPKYNETSLQKWVHHLGDLLKEEQRKYKEEKKYIEMSLEPGTKVRVPKSDFLKSLALHLRNLRRMEEEKRIKLFGPETLVEDFSEDDSDDDYHRTRRTKRRRIARSS